MRKLLGLAAAGLAVLVFGAGAASGNHGTDSASGHVNNLAGFDIDFSARSSNVGTDARGRARFTLTSSDPNQSFTGEVTCLRVVGGTGSTPAMASIGGIVTDQSAGLTFSAFTLFVSDDGKFSQTVDTLGFIIYGFLPPLEDLCPPPSAGVPVADGEITIHNTFP
jgi:hypothetical protein